MDSGDEDYLCWKKIKTKGKTKTFVPKPDYVELKLRTRRQGKCVGAASELFNVIGKESQENTIISNDIWFHLVNYIAPEDVKNYSLICTQSAESVNSQSFWLQLYRRYCQQTSGRSSKWILGLPEELQMVHLRGCDKNILRQRVIQALYRCYPPFQMRLQATYPLELLQGRIYISSWRKSMNSKQLMCYKFQLHCASPFANKNSQAYRVYDDKICPSGAIVDNWECLAEKTGSNETSKRKQPCSKSCAKSLEGIFLLFIYSQRFSPLPIICNHDTGPLRFATSRVLLSSDMKSEDLELNFISAINEKIITIKYLQVLEYKVLPWWHPSFEKFL